MKEGEKKEEREDNNIAEIKEFNDMEEVKEAGFEKKDTLIDVEEQKIIEEQKNIEYIMKLNKENDNQLNEAEQYVRLASESEIELEEKDNLINVLDELKDLLDKGDNRPKSINEVYEIYLENEVITKSHIKDKISELLLKIMFFFEGPSYGVIFLIGIFQMKSLMNALLELLKNSIITFYKCNVNSNCDIIVKDKEINIYDFYEYYYFHTTNETIDFNLMMITGFIGNLILKWKGFKISAGLLSIFNFGSIIWLLNFNFQFKEEGKFDYDFLKILNLAFIYFLLLCGTGGSALLSHQILVESHLKYKDYLIKKMKKNMEPEIKKDIEIKEIKEINDEENLNIKETNIISTDPKIKEPNLDLNNNSSSKSLLRKTIYQKKSANEIIENQIKKKEKNKFDFFFMICLTTILGYLGKYGMNFFLDFILTIIYGEKYDKRLFLIGIMILHAIALLFSILLYQLFKVSIFEYDEKEEEKRKIIKISQVCGYIIYSEKRKLAPAKRNCCTLCCESIQNCCNETFCHLLSNCDCEPKCTCKRCIYDTRDYNKDQEVFRYCYKTHRKSFWCNKFLTNKTQKKIFPYMLEYFVLQLTTIGFEKQYEQYKNENVHRKSWIAVFIGTFILFFYFTLSFTRIVLGKDICKDDKENEDEKENEDKKIRSKEVITSLSNEILKGTHGILLFNGVFSLILSSFYLSSMSEEIKQFLFKDNINVIFMPCLMNKFYYFTLNYYCIYTAEKFNKFEIISGSSLISIYIAIWNLVLTLIKTIIPEETPENDDYNYNNILYIIQIIFSSIPSLCVVIFILAGLCVSTGLWSFLDYDCSCEECRENFNLHKFLCCIFSFFFCFGGLWIKFEDFETYEYECCNIGECCDIGVNCYNVYCFENAIICDCCCCERKSICYSDYCINRCNMCRICGCCDEHDYS